MIYLIMIFILDIAADIFRVNGYILLFFLLSSVEFIKFLSYFLLDSYYDELDDYVLNYMSRYNIAPSSSEEARMREDSLKTYDRGTFFLSIKIKYIVPFCSFIWIIIVMLMSDSAVDNGFFDLSNLSIYIIKLIALGVIVYRTQKYVNSNRFKIFSLALTIVPIAFILALILFFVFGLKITDSNSMTLEIVFLSVSYSLMFIYLIYAYVLKKYHGSLW